tara:strand:- start:558 stop:725 length:168 start_codon:yes stop_codon:yes gene_type:complete
MKFHEWGVFVEKECGATHEVALSDELANLIHEYLNGLSGDSKRIMEPDTKGLILW